MTQIKTAIVLSKEGCILLSTLKSDVEEKVNRSPKGNLTKSYLDTEKYCESPRREEYIQAM